MAIRIIGGCLIAAVALRLDQPVLAASRDFDKLATQSNLRLVT